MKASEFTLIPVEDYYKLNNPIFRGQTALNNELMYYMFWECDGQFFKTYQHI